jgi:cyclopropane fatty-acyl-phospholipid synthase-like methyltransferase
MLASRGHKVFASDASCVGLEILQNRLREKGLNAEVKIADMCECPWNEEFDAVISWDAIHHNTIENVIKAVEVIYSHLCRDGLFIATLKSNKAKNFGLGEFIEKNTYVIPDGVEKGIMHHYFDEEEIKNLFSKWKILLLVEHVSREVITDASLFEEHIFPSTKWAIIAQK